MKILKYLLLLGYLVLSGCSPSTAINPDNPKSSAKYIKEFLSLEEDINESTVEYANGIKHTLHLGEDIWIVLKDDKKTIDQIHFNDLSKKELMEIVELINFPKDAQTFKTILSNDVKTKNISDSQYFTSYNGTGLVIIDGKYLGITNTESPYNMIVIFDETRFEELRDNMH